MRFLPLCAAALVLGMVNASADIVMATGMPSGGSFTGLGNSSDSFTFTTFNTSLGNLTSVEIELNGVTLSGNMLAENQTGFIPGSTYNNVNISSYLAGTITVSSNAGGSVALSAQTNSQAMLDSTGTTYVIAPGQTAGTVNPGPGFGTPGQFTQNVTVTNASPMGSNTNNTVLMGSPAVDGYKGNGTSTITITVAGSSFANGGAAVVVGTSTSVGAGYFGEATASGSVAVVYTYTPVPEPAQTAGLLLGFAMLVMVGRNYLRRSSVQPQAGLAA